MIVKTKFFDLSDVLFLCFVFATLGIGGGVFITKDSAESAQSKNIELNKTILSLKQDKYVLEKQQEVLLKALGWLEE